MDWKFTVYVSSTGRSDVQDEVNRLNVEALERFAAAVRYLAITPKSEWNEPKAKKLTGYKELYEIRFIANNVQLRPIGYFGPEAYQFTILIWATHKQNVYKPSDAFGSSIRRKKAIHEKTAWIATLQIDGEDFPPDGEA